MAIPESPQDLPLPPSLSKLRRQAAAEAEAAAAANREDTVDFESVAVREDFRQDVESAERRAGLSEVDALLQRYHTEKTRTDAGARPLPPLTNGLSPGNRSPRSAPVDPRGNGSHFGEGAGSRAQLPPLTSQSSYAEIERLRAENSELRGMVTELREYVEAHDPEVLATHVRELEQGAAE